MDSPPKGLFVPKSPSQSPTRNETICELGYVSVTDKFGFDWLLLDTKKRLNGVDEIRSPTFSHGGTSEWCMVLSKHGKSWYVSFELLSSQRDPAVEAIVRASLVSSDGTKYLEYPPEIVGLNAPARTHRNWAMAWPEGYIIPDEDIGVDENFYTSILIQGEVSMPSVVTESDMRVTLYKELQCVARDFRRLLESEDFSDIVLRAGSTELKAHRAVLAARSPVFEAMLRHDTREARTGSIVVEDVEPETLREVLRYIYTGSAPLIDEMACALLVAADRYDLPRLKAWCESELCKQLTVDNAASAAVVAATYSCALLKRSVYDFFKNNRDLVLRSEGWTAVVEDNPDIAAEMNRLIGVKPAQ